MESASMAYSTVFLRSLMPIRPLHCSFRRRSSRKHVGYVLLMCKLLNNIYLMCFRSIEHIKVNIDRALHDFKEQSMLANKSVYLPSTRDSPALCLKVDVPADATDEQKKEALRVQDIQKFRSEIGLDSELKLDLVVIGSVVVSRDGYRIGRGNGFADLDIGLLIELGVITPETAIVTIVHDVQVVDTLPVNLFQKYDTPVDIIVTPTEVIRVAKRLPRPNGVFWELLSERRLKILPVLQQLKEQLEKAGKKITLKEEDTDVEQHQNSRRRRGPLRRRFQRGNPGRTTSQTDNEQQGVCLQNMFIYFKYIYNKQM